MEALILETENWTKDHWSTYYFHFLRYPQFRNYFSAASDNPPTYECGLTPFFIALLKCDYNLLCVLEHNLKSLNAFARDLSTQSYSFPKTTKSIKKRPGDKLIEIGLGRPREIRVPRSYFDRLSKTVFPDGRSWRYFAALFNELDFFGQLSGEENVWRCESDDHIVPLAGAIIGGNLSSMKGNELTKETKEWQSKSTGETIYHIAAEHRELPLFVKIFGGEIKLKDFLVKDHNGHSPFDICFFNGTLEKIDHGALDPNSREIATAFQDLKEVEQDFEYNWNFLPTLPLQITKVRNLLFEHNKKRFLKIRERANRIGQKQR